MFAVFSELGRVELTLYTDALVTRGAVRTRQVRVTDILNQSETAFLVLEDVTVTELGGHGTPVRAAFAQINLDAVLFAVADTPVTATPELRAPKEREAVMISVPPFRVTGTLHLSSLAADLHDALSDLTGRFLPVTDATYAAEAIGEAPRTALMVAVNHRRAQIFTRRSPVDDGAAVSVIGEADGTAGDGAAGDEVTDVGATGRAGDEVTDEPGDAGPD